MTHAVSSCRAMEMIPFDYFFLGIFTYILLLCTGNANVPELRVVARGLS